MTGWMECETAGIPGAVRVDLRQADRFPMRSSLRVCGFENSGKERVLAAEGLNLSAAGMALPLALGPIGSLRGCATNSLRSAG